MRKSLYERYSEEDIDEQIKLADEYGEGLKDNGYETLESYKRSRGIEGDIEPYDDQITYDGVQQSFNDKGVYVETYEKGYEDRSKLDYFTEDNHSGYGYHWHEMGGNFSKHIRSQRFINRDVAKRMGESKLYLPKSVVKMLDYGRDKERMRSSINRVSFPQEFHRMEKTDSGWEENAELGGSVVNQIAKVKTIKSFNVDGYPAHSLIAIMNEPNSLRTHFVRKSSGEVSGKFLTARHQMRPTHIAESRAYVLGTMSENAMDDSTNKGYLSIPFQRSNKDSSVNGLLDFPTATMFSNSDLARMKYELATSHSKIPPSTYSLQWGMHYTASNIAKTMKNRGEEVDKLYNQYVQQGKADPWSIKGVPLALVQQDKSLKMTLGSHSHLIPYDKRWTGGSTRPLNEKGGLKSVMESTMRELFDRNRLGLIRSETAEIEPNDQEIENIPKPIVRIKYKR